jgi:hypothetical protein
VEWRKLPVVILLFLLPYKGGVMKKHKRSILLIITALTVLLLILTGCKATAAPNPVPTAGPEQIHPGEPPAASLDFRDTSVQLTAADKGAKEGDLYTSNLFERPFTTAMVYLPDVDIQRAAISSDDSFFYFTITLSGTHPGTGVFEGLYAVELDTNLDGRGDYFIAGLNPSGTTWTTSGVIVRFDSDKDVGGPDPIKSDAPFTGNGYETILANDKPEAAWIRISPSNPVAVQIAVHSQLVGNPKQFLWGITTDNGIKDPGKYDYDDTYTKEQAGSPYVEEPTLYPLKIVNSFDNVCRQPYGFTPTVRIPNMCYSAPPEPGLTPCSAYNRATCPADRCKIVIGVTGAASCVNN